MSFWDHRQKKGGERTPKRGKRERESSVSLGAKWNRHKRATQIGSGTYSNKHAHARTKYTCAFFWNASCSLAAGFPNITHTHTHKSIHSHSWGREREKKQLTRTDWVGWLSANVAMKLLGRRRRCRRHRRCRLRYRHHRPWRRRSRRLHLTLVHFRLICYRPHMATSASKGLME